MTNGRDITLERNPATGLHGFAWDSSGNPEFSDDMSHAVSSLIVEWRGKWWADDTGRRGSNLYLLTEIRKASTDEARVYVEEALDPLVKDGSISDLVVKASRPSPTRIDLSITYKANGRVVSINRSL